MDVSGGENKVQCCKEQYCTGTWNVRSMNQGKLNMVKQKMARLNIDILGISKLKRTEMSEFNSDEHYIYYWGQESLRRNGVTHIVNKSLKYSTWVNSQKQQNDLGLFPRKNLQQASGGDRIPAGLFEILKDDAIKVLQSMYSWFLQPSPTLCYPMDYSPPAPQSMGFSRQEYWSGLPFSSLGDLPDPGIKPASPTLQADSLQAIH